MVVVAPSKLQRQLNSVLEQAKHNAETQDELRGATTGIPALDKMAQGFRYGGLTVVGARPGFGKSAFAFGAGFDAARTYRQTEDRVLLVTLEMPEAEVLTREICRQSKIPLNRFDEGPSNPELERMEDVAAALQTLPIDITTRLRTIEDINREVRAENYKLVIVDYIQLLAQTDSRAKELEDIAYAFHYMAEEKNISVVAISQVRPEVEDRNPKDKRPKTARDLEWSQGIGKAASSIWFLYCQDVYDGTVISGEPLNVEIIVAKGRKSGMGKVMAQFEGKYMTFREA